MKPSILMRHKGDNKLYDVDVEDFETLDVLQGIDILDGQRALLVKADLEDPMTRTERFIVDLSNRVLFLKLASKLYLTEAGMLALMKDLEK